MILTDEAGDWLLQLAVRTLAYAVRTGREPELQALSLTPPAAAVTRPMGAFVTLKRNRALRGCIGEILPRRPLWQAVKAQTLNAALRDDRFAPVSPSELTQLTIEISALTPPRPVDQVDAIALGRHGIILSFGGRMAVFLPQVAPEQGWTLTETLSQLARKAGLPADAWRERDARLEVFEAMIFSGPATSADS